MKLKKGMKVKFIKDLSKNDQTEIDMSKYINRIFKAVDHFQNSNNNLSNGEMQVDLLEEGGIIILNKNEYEIIG